MSTAAGRLAKLTKGKKSTSSECDQQQLADSISSASMEQPNPPQRNYQQVKVKSASVESNQNLVPTIRCSALNTSFAGDEEGNGGESSALCSPPQPPQPPQPNEPVKSTTTTTTTTSKELSKPSSGMKNFLSIGAFSPLRPSLSTSCLFSSSTSADAETTAATSDKDCDKTTDADRKRQLQQQSSSTSALVCIPTRASLTHEWKKLKTPNKCRECNLLVYFNGRECGICGFVAHKKCITVLVIKCHRNQFLGLIGNSEFLQQPSQASGLGAGLGASIFASLSGGSANQNIRSPFSSGGYSLYGNRRGNKWALLSQQQQLLQQQQQQQQQQHHQQRWPRYRHSQHQRPIFGQPIPNDDIEAGAQVLDFIRRFIYEIDTRGLTSKGIYRVSSIKSKVDKLCNYYDQNLSSLVDLSSFHPNIIANALKMYLRRLPEPLLTNNLYEQFIGIAKRHSRCQASESSQKPREAREEDQQQIEQAEHRDRASLQQKSPVCHNMCMKSHHHQQAGGQLSRQCSIIGPDAILSDFAHVIEGLPPMNKQIVAIIMRHLKRVADMAEENQMSAKNLSIIFGPTLLSASEKSSLAIVDNIHQAQVVELMISLADLIFPSSTSEHHHA